MTVITWASQQWASGPPHPPAVANVFVPDMPLTVQGDSISALADDSGWIYWAQYYTYGRWGYNAGALQAISGSEIAENNNFHDIMRADRYAQMIDCVSADQALMLMIGTNTLSATDPPTPQLDALDTIWTDIRAKGGNIIGALVLPSSSNIGLPSVTTFNDYIEAQGSNDDFLVVDGPTAWGGTYVGNTDSGNLHPNVLGSQKIGQAVATALTTKGYELGASYGQGGSNPADNLALNWNFTGTGGTKAGTNSAGISGSVPSSTTITLNSAGVTMVVSVTTVDVPVLSENMDGSWSASIETFPALQLDMTGTASGAATNSVLMGVTISPGEAAGSTYECLNYFSCTKTDGTSLPAGVTLGMLGNSATPGKWAAANTSAGAGTLSIPLTGGHARTLVTNVLQNTGTNGVTFQWRQNAGAVDCRIVLAMPYFRKSGRTAYSLPIAAHTNKLDWSGPISGPKFSNASGSPPAGSISNGVVVTLRPGDAWRGGGISFTYQWQKSPDKVAITDIGGATNITYTPATGNGYLRCKVTATNSFGSTVDYTEWSTNSI